MALDQGRESQAWEETKPEIGGSSVRMSAG
jgi:hypothetical protein